MGASAPIFHPAFCTFYAISPGFSFFSLWERVLRGTAVSRYVSSGSPVLSTTAFVIVQIPILLSEGTSYIRSIITDSKMERSPLAPVFLATASPVSYTHLDVYKRQAPQGDLSRHSHLGIDLPADYSRQHGSGHGNTG